RVRACRRKQNDQSKRPCSGDHEPGSAKICGETGISPGPVLSTERFSNHCAATEKAKGRSSGPRQKFFGSHCEKNRIATPSAIPCIARCSLCLRMARKCARTPERDGACGDSDRTGPGNHSPS